MIDREKLWDLFWAKAIGNIEDADVAKDLVENKRRFKLVFMGGLAIGVSEGLDMNKKDFIKFMDEMDEWADTL